MRPCEKLCPIQDGISSDTFPLPFLLCDGVAVPETDRLVAFKMHTGDGIFNGFRPKKFKVRHHGKSPSLKQLLTLQILQIDSSDLPCIFFFGSHKPVAVFLECPEACGIVGINRSHKVAVLPLIDHIFRKLKHSEL